MPIARRSANRDRHFVNGSLSVKLKRQMLKALAISRSVIWVILIGGECRGESMLETPVTSVSFKRIAAEELSKSRLFCETIDLSGVRFSYATRRVPRDAIATLLPIPEKPQPGQLALAQLEKIGKNGRLELADGRNCTLYEGDVLAVVFGNRYATNQFEGYAGANGTSCDLMSMGGLCGLVASKHSAVPDPSRLKLIGLLADQEARPIGIGDYGLSPASEVALPVRPTLPPVIAVCGTSMDAGKTYTVTSLVRGLRGSDRQVASIKLTGTASGRDTWSMRDAGAFPALDFIDGGFASTYLCSTGDLLELFHRLRAHAADQGADCITLEIADGLLQRETAALLRDPAFISEINTWVLAAGDAMGAIAGVELMRDLGLQPAFISGILTQSPLAMREAEAITGIRCVTAAQLREGSMTEIILPKSHFAQRPRPSVETACTGVLV